MHSIKLFAQTRQKVHSVKFPKTGMAYIGLRTGAP